MPAGSGPGKVHKDANFGAWKRRSASVAQALADALALESQVLSYIRAAHRVDRAAAVAFVPYGAWLAYITVLNAQIAWRNPQAA